MHQCLLKINTHIILLKWISATDVTYHTNSVNDFNLFTEIFLHTSTGIVHLSGMCNYCTISYITFVNSDEIYVILLNIQKDNIEIHAVFEQMFDILLTQMLLKRRSSSVPV